MKALLAIIGKSTVIILTSGIISSVFVMALRYILKLDAYQGIILGAVLFISSLAVQLAHRLVKAADTLNELAIMQNSVDEFTSKVRQISEGLNTIARRYAGKNDLFVPWYDEKLDSLISHISYTIQNESFDFDVGPIKQRNRLFNVFEGTNSDHFRATSSCAGIEWYLTTDGNIFLQGIDKKFMDGKIRSVKRLFIYDQESELEDFRTRLCFYLHEQSGYEYKIISRDDFNTIVQGFGDRTLVADFGVYGLHFVWETIPEAVIIRHGNVCVEKRKIENYIQLFENLWSQGIPQKIEDHEIINRYKDCRLDSFRELYRAFETSNATPQET